jgi:DNA-binding MarR family transcriptional regulator
MPRPRRPRPRPEALDALVAAAPLATRWIERVLASHDPPLTVAQYLAVRAAARRPLTATDIARSAGVSTAAVSQLVASLEQAGLVERHPVADDRRRQTLALTSVGERALAAVTDRLRSELAFVLGDVPGPELAALARLLGHVGSSLERTPPPARPHPAPPEGRPPPRR